ncbi:hypothetical protein [Sphingopyxis sp. BSNA05]|uniref:hypothetical protein n=1 Tax=Sphingopyxis sp. BSNA05 TaxID=1236614 RepID=UPI001C25226A|nr:hypothetical protein [Sphingopyxis sp. BSNA05]
MKQNLQIDRQNALSVELGNVILRKLGNDPLFISASLAEKSGLPFSISIRTAAITARTAMPR